MMAKGFTLLPDGHLTPPPEPLMSTLQQPNHCRLTASWPHTVSVNPPAAASTATSGGLHVLGMCRTPNATIRYESDANQAPIKRESGANQAPIKRQSGPNQAPIRPQSGPNQASI